MGTQYTYPLTTPVIASSEKNKQIMFFIETLGDSYDEGDFLEKIQSCYPLSSSLLYQLTEKNALRAWFSTEVVKTARQVDISSALGQIAAKWKDGYQFAKRIENCCSSKGIDIDSTIVLQSGLNELSQLFGGVSFSPLGYLDSLYKFYKQLPDTSKTHPSILHALLRHALLVIHKIDLAETILRELNLSLSACFSYVENDDHALLFSLLTAPKVISFFVLNRLFHDIDAGDQDLLTTQNPVCPGIPLVSCAVALGQFEIAKKLLRLDLQYRKKPSSSLYTDKFNPIKLGIEVRRKHYSLGERQELQFMIGAYISCDDGYQEILHEQSQKRGFHRADVFTKEQKKMFDCGQVSFEGILRKIKK